MNNTIRTELNEYIEDCKRDFDTVTHFNMFNEDYYIIGYYNAKQWLKRHSLDTFDAIAEVQQYEVDNFGEARVYDNAESLVNMLVYIYGEQLCLEQDIKFD